MGESPVSDIESRIRTLSWWHQIRVGGIVTPGLSDIGYLSAAADLYFGDGVAGKTVLDIGCWDGFNSLEAMRRGAARVLATDHWVWAHHPTATRATIELVRDVEAPGLEIMDIDLPDISPHSVGMFDVVLFCGVLYHLRNMLDGLERAASVARELLVVETHLDAMNVKRPSAIFYPGASLNGDGSNWWGPNRACVEGMLHEIGFRSVEYLGVPSAPTRGIFKAWRDQRPPAKRSQDTLGIRWAGLAPWATLRRHVASRKWGFPR